MYLDWTSFIALRSFRSRIHGFRKRSFSLCRCRRLATKQRLRLLMDRLHCTTTMASSSSFSFHHYPRRLLHTDTEPQWFAPSERERKSSLDTLERQERALRARLRAAVLPELSADPIGVAGATDDRHKQFVVSQLHRDNSRVDPTEKMPAAGEGGAAISFWDKYRPRYEELLRRNKPDQQQQQQEEEGEGEEPQEDGADEASMEEEEQQQQVLQLQTPPAKPPAYSSSRFRLSLESSAGSAMSLGDD